MSAVETRSNRPKRQKWLTFAVNNFTNTGDAMIKKHFPYMNLEGVVGAGYGGSHEGWLDPYSLMQAFRRKAVEVWLYAVNVEEKGCGGMLMLMQCCGR